METPHDAPEPETVPAIPPEPHPLSTTVLPARLFAVVNLLHATTSGATAMSYVRGFLAGGYEAYAEVGLSRLQATATLLTVGFWPVASLGLAWLAFEYAARISRSAVLVDPAEPPEREQAARGTLRFWFRGVVVLECLTVVAYVVTKYYLRK